MDPRKTTSNNPHLPRRPLTRAELHSLRATMSPAQVEAWRKAQLGQPLTPVESAALRMTQELMRKPKPATSFWETPLTLREKETQVRVRLEGDTETKQRWLLVSVRSNVRDHLWAHKKVDPEQEPVRRNVQRAAEGLAVHQCQAYGDRHDPVAAGHAALDALDDLAKQAKNAREGRGRG
jgi:hypothetical protein